MSIKDYSVDELEAELERRKKKSEKKPAPIAWPDFSKIPPLCASYIEQVVNDETADSDIPNYVFEAALEACYGESVWAWVRAHT